MDDEKVTYKGYELAVKYGIKNICVHKGLFPQATAERWPHLLAYADVRDVGKAAKDWPQLNFVIYHGGYRHAAGGRAEAAGRSSRRPGASPGCRDLAEIPEKFGVTNVYADVGQLFAQSVVAQPQARRRADGHHGQGHGRTTAWCWGTDAVWTGSPQWQIEALRRLEIPEDMQKKHGFKPLGAADGPIKTMIFGGTNAKLYNYRRQQAHRHRPEPRPLRAHEGRVREATARRAPTCATATCAGRWTGRRSPKQRPRGDQKVPDGRRRPTPPATSSEMGRNG